MAERKLMHLRRDDVCSRCSRAQPVGIQAYWLKTERVVLCVDCGDRDQASVESVPGASAAHEGERRHDARIDRARSSFGRVGAFVARLSDGPAHERAFAAGAAGERRTAERLMKHLDGAHVHVLHDRCLRSAGVQIDHIAIASSGVTIIDSKKWRGKVKVDWHGGLFTERRYELYVGGHKRSKAVEGVVRQVEVVRTVLAEERMSEIPVGGALCMVNVEELPLFKRLRIGQVVIDGPKPIARLISEPGRLDDETVEAVTAVLNRRLRPAAPIQ